jgi:hypothetical protein
MCGMLNAWVMQHVDKMPFSLYLYKRRRGYTGSLLKFIAR